MRRTITLNPNEEYPFDIGRNALIMIIRNATQNVIFRGDSLTPIELSRSDIVHVNEFRNQRMFLCNLNAVPITVEFQLSDTLISIREQRMAINGGIVIDEIASPVTVSEIQAPVAITSSETLKVSASHNKHYRNFQMIHGGTGSFFMHGPFMYVMIQAHAENTGNVKFLGINIPPNGYYELNVPYDAPYDSIYFDVNTDKANVVWIRDMNAVRSLPNRDDSDAEYIIQGDERIHYLDWEKAHGME